MKNIKFMIAAIALLVAGAAQAQDLSSVQADFAKAAAAVKATDFATASTLFEKVIDQGLDIEGAESLVAGAKQYLPTTLYRVGGTSFQAGNLEEALAAFTRAAETAELYGNAKVLNDARTWIGQTISKQGADAFNNKDYATAATIFQKGYDANPNDTALAMNLARSYIGLADYAKGNDIYRAILTLGEQDSRFAEAAVQAGKSFITDNLLRAQEAAGAQDYASAIAATDEILAAIPTDATTAMFRLQVYNNAKNYAKVIEVGDAAAELQSTDELRSAANYLVGIAYQNRENWAKAIEYLRKVTVGPNAADAKAQIVELQKAL